MKRIIPLLALPFAAIAFQAPATAATGIAVGDMVGTTETAIRDKLEALGGTVDDIETEDGVIEAEVVMNGTSAEIGIDPETGKVLKIDNDDEGDEETDDD